jgi:hypothetical protein
MRAIDIFISGGSDTNRHRDLASEAIDRLRQVLQYELGLDVTITSWNYRHATPTVVPGGTLAATSLANVDRSDVLVGIFAKSLPRITQEEVREALTRRQNGESQELFVFANPNRLTARHWDFFNELRDTFGEEIVFGHYTDRVTFQASLYTTLFKYLFERLTTANPPLLSGARP